MLEGGGGEGGLLCVRERGDEDYMIVGVVTGWKYSVSPLCQIFNVLCELSHGDRVHCRFV